MSAAPAEPFRRRHVALTGAASGIGRALALRFARGGARVVALDRDAAGLEALAKAAVGLDLDTAVLDVTDPDACHAQFAALREERGGLDVLINDAGISQRSAFAETELEVFRRVMEVNFFGALYCTKAALPALLASRGLIVTVSSVAGFAPLLDRSGYCASKHALHGLFDTLRCELRPQGVDVLLVCPGFTSTAIEQNALGADGAPAQHPQTRVGRQQTPESVAEAIHGAAARRQRLLVLSPVGRTTRWLTRVAPALYERLMARSLHESSPG
ncbi:MAG: SDR family oxidoreductase [Myxococcota bacterium]|nr:SDR family oxidoreductase [Myxococcota bacterium]